MPVWMQWIIGAAALAGAIGVLWAKVIRPSAKFISTSEEMLPLLRSLVAEFRDTPGAFKVLDEIVAQFRTDSGSSLRDVVNRLEAAATEGKMAADLLKVGVESAKQLAEQDREQLRRLILLLDRITIKVDAGSATSLRMEEKATGIADDLIVATRKVEGVAQDLADSHRRADETHHTAAPGAAADAAAQQTIKEKHQAEVEDNSGEPGL